ncbi:unnamed protein product [Ilex paraguariensis]
MKLTKEEKQKVSDMLGVVSVFPNGKKQLHTTRSWDFLGFSEHVNRSNIESDIIIGVLDTGIWPESDSFIDEGFGPPPSKWKGSCQNFENFTCNNKIIGARYYHANGSLGEEDFESPRDSDGHGTHTSSTAAGGLVSMASLMGFGLDSSRRGSISTCCCVQTFDDAIADGVDILSVSLGALSGSLPSDYFDDSIAIGAFHAMKNGILTSASAGNDGPDLATIGNYSPWIVTVGANTIDRTFSTKVQLGNKMVYEGVSINTFDLKNSMYPMIYAGNAPNITGGFNRSLSSQHCRPAGAKDVAYSFPLPATYVGENDGASIFIYLNSTSNATATILKSTEVNDTLAPFVASLSSRGPNPITSDILKPDIAAPGIEILAAWSLNGPLSGVLGDKRREAYNIISGTSMACPHVTGVAAYVKSFHPSWSPAAIKSALMTTASPMDVAASSNAEDAYGAATPLGVATTPDAEFGYGAGHVNPTKAVDPGLIYDAGEIDYVKFLCGQGYNTTNLRQVTGDNTTCSEARNGIVWDLNLPSFALSTSPVISFSQNFSRTVTNVGSPRSTYNAKITAPQSVKIQVEPTVLPFTSLEQKLSFVVKVEGRIGSNTIESASLVWDDGVHQVRSPIVVYSLS